MGTNEKKKAHRRKEYLILGAFFLVVVAGALVLQSMMLEGRRLKGHFEAPSGEHSEMLYLRIASTPAERQKGLMFENNLPKNEGMIFIFAGEAPLSFWMKNTPLPLDMIFLNADMLVNGVVENTTPFSTQRYSVPEPSKYVVEVNAGQAKVLGVRKGSRLVLAGPIPRAVVDTTKTKED